MTVHCYSCFGLFLQSAIALPEIAGAATAADRVGQPAVTIRFGAVPAELPGAEVGHGGVAATATQFLLTVPGVARYLVSAGAEIVVDPAPDVSWRNLRLYLLGTALGVLCHQRGLLPLHANAIVTREGEAVAFAGHSGAGKSTLAAYFQQAGYDVLCDDVCVLSFDPGGRPWAWPGLPRLKLWGDAAASFGYDGDRLEPIIDGWDKYHIPLASLAGTGPYPLRGLYVLGRSEEDEAGQMVRLTGVKAYEAIAAQTYRSNYLQMMGLRQRHFSQCMAALRHVDVFHATRAWGFDVFAQEAARIEAHLNRSPVLTAAEP